MIYDLKKIELEQIERDHKNRIYKIERDRLKMRYFIYLDYPLCDYYGLNVSQAKRYVYADFIARFQRLKGRNVLFSMGYNNTTSTILNIASKLDKPLSSFTASGFLEYQKELKLLEVGFDEEKEIIMNNEEYVSFVQKFYQFLFEKKLITLKNGLVVFDDDKIYQKGEYYYEGENYYSLSGKKLNKKIKNYYSLSINTIKKSLVQLIDELDINDIGKTLLLERLMYEKVLKFKCLTSSENYLEISVDNPECICGLSFIILNPNYLDVKPFINPSEYDEIADRLYESKEELLFAGTYIKAPIVNNDIPIFISTKFDETVHLGIPSLNEIDENLCSMYDLEYNPIFDYINNEKILVNSGRFNGMNLLEAKDEIAKYLIEHYDADEFSHISLDELNISAMHKFGIPTPIRNDQTLANIPVVYNLKHDVKLEEGELADRNLVKDFICDDFVNALLVNAIRLKGDMGILDFLNKSALDEIGLFNNIDVLLLNQENYVNDLLWNLIIGEFWKKYYVSTFGYDIKKVLVIKPLLDSKLQYMHRDKNNLVSIKDMLANYGSTILRLYYASLGLDDDNNSFDYVEVDAIKELVDKITKLFYFPIDDSCSDLDDEYEKMVFDCKRCAKENDFRSYLENIIFFVNKVYTVHHISRTQAKGLLIILSVLTPALAEKIKEDVLNLKEPLLYYSWPEN